MVLKSFGCSFIFGTDLRDDGRNCPYAIPSQFSWPALLAKDLGYPYACYAYPGSGNLRILERVMSESVSCDGQDLFVIGWSWIDRFDYTSKDDQWSTIMPVDTTDNAGFYYRHLHSQYRDKLTTLVCIKSAIDVLKNKKIPFIMTHIDDLIWEDQWHTTPAIMDTQDYIRPYISDFEGKTFLEFSRYYGFEISKTSHPLESAHRRAFEIVKNDLDRYVKNQA